MGRQKLPFPPLFFSVHRPIYRGRIVSANHPIKCPRGRFIARVFAGKKEASGERRRWRPPTYSRTIRYPDDDAPGRLLTMKYDDRAHGTVNQAGELSASSRLSRREPRCNHRRRKRMFRDIHVTCPVLYTRCSWLQHPRAPPFGWIATELTRAVPDQRVDASPNTAGN